MAIRNLQQLRNAIIVGKMPQILEVASKVVVRVMQEELQKAEISTRSLRKSIIYEIQGNQSKIFIDYDLVQEKYAEQSETKKVGEKVYYTWGWFTNTYSGSGGTRNEETWNGLPISFNLAKWIEEGQSGNGKLIGNQPIKETRWFTNTINRLKKELPQQIKVEMAKKK